MRTTPKEITLYTTPTCPRCKRLAAWLSEHDCPFQTKDLTIPANLAEVRIGGCFDMEAPLLQVGDTFYPSGWLFQGEIVQTGKLREVLE